MKSGHRDKAQPDAEKKARSGAARGDRTWPPADLAETTRKTLRCQLEELQVRLATAQKQLAAARSVLAKESASERKREDGLIVLAGLRNRVDYLWREMTDAKLSCGSVVEEVRVEPSPD